MAIVRLIAILLLASLASAQELSSPKVGHCKTPKPKLPVVDDRACPGKGTTVPHFKITQADRIYTSWHDTGKPVGTLKAGEEVTILAGLNVVREPATAIIKYVGPDADPALKVGDTALGYGIEDLESGGVFVFWSKGVWIAVWTEAVAERGQCGFTIGFGKGGCEIDIIKDGVSEWWVEVKTSSGLVGWVLADKFNHDNPVSVNFSDLCHFGED